MTNDFQQRKSSDTQKEKKGFLPFEEYVAKRNRERSELYTLLDQVTEEVRMDSHKLESYLSLQARLDKYSASNALLIFKQMPEATQLKESKAWGEEGVFIKKGERHISILEPVERKDGKIGIVFNVKSVFDVSQTTSSKRTPAPDFRRSADKVLIAMLDTAPVNIENVDKFTFGETLAEYRNEDATLYVKRNAGDPVKLFQSVALELAFAELSVNGEKYDRSELAFDAVCVANMLCKKYGVPYDRFEFTDCPPAWKSGSVKEVREELSKIREATSGICSRVGDVIYQQRQQERTQDKSPRSPSDRER